MKTIIGLITIYSGFKVILTSNGINSVLNLVLVMVTLSILLIVSGKEYLGWLFIIVYVGAIAVLLIFVIMMLNINTEEREENSTRYLAQGIIVGGLLWLTMLEKVRHDTKVEVGIDSYNIDNLTNIEAIGKVLYTSKMGWLEMSGMILLIAMIGAIILSLGHEEVVKRQDIFSQIKTDYRKTVRLIS